MIEALNRKLAWITPPAAIADNVSPATASVDTLGYDWATIVVGFGTMDIAMATFKLQEADADSGYADITGANFATGTLSSGSAATLPSATDDNHFFAFHVNMKGRKRFLDLVITAGDGAAGTYVVAWAELWRAKETPSTAAKRGYTGEIFV